MIWVRRKFPALYECFREFVYSENCPSKTLKYEFENKKGMAGVSFERMVRLLMENGYSIDVICYDTR